MPIRDLYHYIREHISGSTKEEIIKQLKGNGYADDEIEEAFLMFESDADHGRPAEEQKSAQRSMSAPQSALPTLLEIVERKAEKEGEVPEEVDKEQGEPVPQKDWSMPEAKLEYWSGVFIPTAIYYFSIVVFTFLSLLSEVAAIAPFVPFAVGLVMAFIMRLLFRNVLPYLSAGLSRGMALLFILAGLSLLVHYDYISVPFNFLLPVLQ